jgi:hypothetical protein
MGSTAQRWARVGLALACAHACAASTWGSLAPDAQSGLPVEVQAVTHRHAPEAPPTANAPLFVIYSSADQRKAQIDGGFILAEFYHLTRLLEVSYGWRRFVETGTPTTWREIVDGLAASFGRVPDAVLVTVDEDTGARLARAMASRPSAASTPRALFIADDLQFYNDAQHENKSLIYTHFDVVAATYAYNMKSFYPDVTTKHLVWLPHSATHLFALPFNPSPRRQILMSGEVNPRWYAHRHMIVRRYVRQGDPRFTYLQHPGYEGTFGAATSGVGAGYARILNDHLVCFTCSSSYNYVVAKMLEIPAAGCLLLVNQDVVPQLGALGLRENRHFVTYNRTNIDDVANVLLSPEAAASVDRMRLEGMHLVRTRHMVTLRAQQLHQVTKVATKDVVVRARRGRKGRRGKHARSASGGRQKRN